MEFTQFPQDADVFIAIYTILSILDTRFSVHFCIQLDAFRDDKCCQANEMPIEK